MLESIFIFLADLIKSILTFLKIIIRSKYFISFKTAEVKDIIILGNGPSLKENLKSHQDILKKFELMGVNNLPSTPAFELLQPSKFIIISEEFWNPGSISKHQEKRDNIIKNLVQKTTWPITCFLPQRAKKNNDFVAFIKSNKNITVHFFNTTPTEGLSSFNRLFMKMGLAMPRPHNVLIPSLYVCIQSMYKNIYLIGADHSWIPLISVDNQNNALVNQQHFYDDQSNNSEAMHQKSKPRRLHQILEKFMLSFKAYFDLKDFAESKGVHIFNCTPDSFIDAFDRKDLIKILEDMPRKEIS